MNESSELACGDCGAPMRLVPKGRHGPFYGCSRYPECTGVHGMHKETGEPYGVPADRSTRKARTEAHKHFDQIWKSGLMSRTAAYGWMRTVLGIPREKAHIAMFNERQCALLIEACNRAMLQTSAATKDGNG